MKKFGLFRKKSSKKEVNNIADSALITNVEYQNIISLKDPDDGFTVEYEIAQIAALQTADSDIKAKILTGLNDVESRLQQNDEKLGMLRDEEDRLTNHADSLDYAVAVASGLLTGTIDALLVGELDISSSKSWSNQQINEVVMQTARKEGYTGDRLSGAIKKLEDTYKYAGDGIYQAAENTGYHISNKSHHLDDFRHHPTAIGLMCSLITQFSSNHIAFFSNRYGQNVSFSVADDGELIGHNFQQKIIAGTFNWMKHLISDMSGSNKTSGTGMGLPGPLLSTLKEISALPVINETQLSSFVNDLFIKQRFNLQSEIALGKELGRQALPVVLNESLVRAFYFARRFVEEYQKADNLDSIRLDRVFPTKNRTMARMLTISSGTFMAVDMADAAIKAAMKSSGNIANFASSFVLRVNFVGIGRFVIALGSDIGMEFQRQRVQDEQIQIYMEQICLSNAKLFYKQADMWISAKEAGLAILNAYQALENAVTLYNKALTENDRALVDISNNIKSFKRNNPDLKDIWEDL